MKTTLFLPVLLGAILTALTAPAQQPMTSVPRPPQPVIVQPTRPQIQPPRPPQPVVVQPTRPQIQPPRPPQPVIVQPTRPQIQPPRPVVQPPRPPVGYNGWQPLATIAVRQPYGQSSTVLNGAYTNFRFLKLMVYNMPLNVGRLVVSYEYGPVTVVPMHYRLVPGGESHSYTVQNPGSRRIRRIGFSYSSAAPLNRANVTILGLR